MKSEFVPLEKRSKREQREYYASRRKTWGGIDPVTRKPPNPRAYTRKKAGRRYEHEPSPVFSFFLLWKSRLKPNRRGSIPDCLSAKVVRNSLAILLCVVLLSAAASGCVSRTEPKTETRPFVDSVGREVMIPLHVDRIAASGSYAQMILYTLCPEKLMGLSESFSKVQKKYIEEQYHDLPVFGRLYGSSGTYNLEAVMKAAPDVIIDMGEVKPGIAENLDSIQSRTGIPVLFIQATMDTIAEAYDKLGEIAQAGERAALLSGYIRDVLDFARDTRNGIAEDSRPGVMYSQGEYGNEVNGKGSIHSEVLDIVGVRNAADMDSILSSGGDEVSMEQIMIWNPEILILAPDSNYAYIYNDKLWAQVDAVKNRRVYEVPIGPYNWLDRPPSVQRIMGILWLGNLIYPEFYDFDIVDKTREFYRLFFRYELSADEAAELLANAR